MDLTFTSVKDNDMKTHLRLLVAAAGAALLLSAPLRSAPATDAQPLVAYTRVEDAGFSPVALEAAREFADRNNAAAVVALYRGRVVASWGAVDRRLMAHSIRKTLASALYGIASQAGTLPMTATLATLGIDDEPPLTADERQATVRDLVRARSGVYHGAAYADAGQEKDRPARGSHAPGTFWFYNNWDFNVLETIYARVTHSSVYDAFARQIATPLGMEDFSPVEQLEVLEPSRSRFAAHTFRISARDLARFGQLYLQQGQWNGAEIVPAAWVRDSWTTHSVTGEHEGYGNLWWIFNSGALGANFPTLNAMDVYLARGTGGQALFVIPAAEMVIVHRGDTDHNRPVSGPAIWQLVERLVAARTNTPVERPVLGAVVTERLANVLPATREPAFIAMTPDITSRLVGDYGPAGGPTSRVFVFDGRLFLSAPGEGEAELSAVSPLSFVVRSQPGIAVRFTTNADGSIAGAEIQIGARTLKAPRR